MQLVGGEGKGCLLSEIYLESIERDKGPWSACQSQELHV